MFLFGEKIGMAFQIKDDLLDFGDEQTGKPKGIDVKEKKLTLPLIYALSKAEASEKRRIIRMIKQDSESAATFTAVYDLIVAQGGMEYARARMNQYRDEAFEILFSMPESPARTSLEQLVYFVTDRKN
mgnify:CR=1 FL=1